MLIFAILLCYINLYNEFSKDDIYLFGGLLCINNYKIIFSKLLIIITFIIISLSSFHPKKLNNTNKGKLEKIFNKLISKREVKMIIEYPLIILFCITGGIFLMFSSDIISVFLAIELQSYGLYLLCSIYRNSENSVNAGLTYFLLGALSSCIILLGQSLIYLNTGSTNLENVYIIKNIYDTIFYNTELLYNSNIYYLNSIQYSLIIFSVGLLFKISSAPFHF
jgi:NADH-ubiquinone oxidoreductase chain 2